ncbi:hypothetical protein [Bosea caraganae]|uniref:hypothetical protein n=1 Tax=Bosea caraganae TaxID=2763117 RepID=UPI0011C024C6|nr:hypothetical protein [Bosea caraganae]
MGGLFAYLMAEATTALKRKAIVYGLISFSGLLVIFAGRYVLNAAYAWLLFRYGPTAASLTIAGGMLVLAIVAIGAARIIAGRPNRPAQFVSRSAPSTAGPYRSRGKRRSMALAAGASGAVTAAAAAAAVFWFRGSPRR